MKSMTNREYEARLAWINLDLNHPDKSDWYLMQVAAEVRKSWANKPNLVHLKDYKLSAEESTKPLSKEELTAISRARWYSMLNIK